MGISLRDCQTFGFHFVCPTILVLISPTFYEQLFQTKVFRAAFMYLYCRFVLFWRKEIGAKAACKMLVKLTLGEATLKIFISGFEALSLPNITNFKAG